MPKLNITEKEISKLKGTGELVHYFDESLPGFGVYVKGVAKTYFVKGRVGGRQIMHAIGKVGEFKTVKDARHKAGELLQMMRQGIDPREQKKAAHRAAAAESRKNITLQKVLDEYLGDRKTLKESTREFYRTCIEVYLADLKERPIRDITAAEVKEIHKNLSEKKEAPVDEQGKRKRVLRGGPGIADGVMKVLRLLCNHVIEEHPGVLIMNPVSRLKKKWNRPKARENYIKQDDLPAWFEAVTASKNDTMRDALLLMLFTGLRSKTEAFCMKWSDVDFTSKTMRFEDTKNGTTLLLPMSTFVYDLLKVRKDAFDAMKKEDGDDDNDIPDFVFPGSGEKGHIVDIRKELERIAAACKVDITPHDLRRTFLTYAEFIDIPLYTRRALVNHSTGKGKDVTAGYTQIPLDRLRTASQMIAEYILLTK